MLHNVYILYGIYKGAVGLNIILNLEELTAMILFGIGFTMLVFSRNIMKKVLGLNIMDTGVYLFLASMGYIEGNLTPIVPSIGTVKPEMYINPIPTGLVLTGIVVSVSFSALMLALTVRLYKKYRTLNLDEIYAKCDREDGED